MDMIPMDSTPSALVPRSLCGLPYLADYSRLADAICKTEMVPDSLRNRADAVLAVVMAGYELGLGPMQSLQGINMIKGKPSVSPETMRALIMQNGHQLRLTATSTEATLRCHRKDWPADEWDTFTYSMDDAKGAGLTGNDTWKKYPRNMLTARVTSEAARAVFSDVISGLHYTPDEVEEFAPVPTGLSRPGEVNVVDAEVVEVITQAQAEQLRALLLTIEDEQARTIAQNEFIGVYGKSADVLADKFDPALAFATELVRRIA